MDFKQLAAQYKNELFENVLPFWLHRSQDFEQGGYYTCLNRRGEVFDTDKFVWLQGREVWLFSMLYNMPHQELGFEKLCVSPDELLRKIDAAQVAKAAAAKADEATEEAKA